MKRVSLVLVCIVMIIGSGCEKDKNGGGDPNSPCPSRVVQVIVMDDNGNAIEGLTASGVKGVRCYHENDAYGSYCVTSEEDTLPIGKYELRLTAPGRGTLKLPFDIEKNKCPEYTEDIIWHSDGSYELMFCETNLPICDAGKGDDTSETKDGSVGWTCLDCDASKLDASLRDR